MAGRGHGRDCRGGSRRVGSVSGRRSRRRSGTRCALGGERRIPAAGGTAAHHGAAGGGGQRRGRPVGAPRRRSRRDLRAAGSHRRRADRGHRPAGRRAAPAGDGTPRPACGASAAGLRRRDHPAPSGRPGPGRAHDRRAGACAAERGRTAERRRSRWRRLACACRVRRLTRRRSHSRRRDPGRASERGAGADERPAEHRRPSRRRRLAPGHAHHRVRPAAAARRRAGHRGDRSLHRLRHAEPLLRRARPLLRSGARPREPVGPGSDLQRRHDHPLLRPVPRSAARLRVLGQRLRGPERRHPRLERAGGRDGRRRAAQQRRRRPARRRRRVRGRRAPGRDERVAGRRTRRRAGRRHLLGRPFRVQRHPGRGRLDGRDGDSVQEPALSVTGPRRAPSLGLSGRTYDPEQERDRRLGADLPRRRRLPAADGPARRADRPVDEPQPGDPAHAHRHPVRVARHRHRRLRGRRPRPRGRLERQVRRDPQPDVRLHLQPRLLADRVRHPADRGQPAVPALLPGAAAVLPGGPGDLPGAGSGQPGPHAHHRRPAAGGQAHRQGGQHHGRRAGRQRRGPGPGGGCRPVAARQDRAGGRRPGAL